jgi:hypothetical protein
MLEQFGNLVAANRPDLWIEEGETVEGFGANGPANTRRFTRP